MPSTNELDGKRLYQPSSTDGVGFGQAGLIFGVHRRLITNLMRAFKTEIGSMSISDPSAVHAMMPERIGRRSTTDWAEHDFGQGRGKRSDDFQAKIASRYGPVADTADFVRKGQLNEL